MISCDCTQILAGDLIAAAPPVRCGVVGTSAGGSFATEVLLIELALLTTDETMAALEDWDWVTWVLVPPSVLADDVDGDWVVRTVPLLVITI